MFGFTDGLRWLARHQNGSAIYYTNDTGFAILAWVGAPFTRELLPPNSPVIR